MPGHVVIGGQWGDEGKGKVVDFFAQDRQETEIAGSTSQDKGKDNSRSYINHGADAVVRYAGANNAGHTIVTTDGKRIKLRITPSGVCNSDARLFIGNGVLVNPEVQLSELAYLKNMGIEPDLIIDERAHVVMDYHILEDRLSEAAKGRLAAGSTFSGVAPGYSDKAARIGIRIADLIDEKMLREKLEYLVPFKQKIFRHVYDSDETLNIDAIFEKYSDLGRKIAPMVGNVSYEINRMLDDRKYVIFEGAQAVMLDIDHGLYPHGTSSNTEAGSACVGTGVSPRRIDDITMVMKAYLTRVGTGPLPSEMHGELADIIREKGGEFGTVTGRARRIAWNDMPSLRHAVMIVQPTGIALTKIDVLSGLGKINVCTHYMHDGKRIDYHPASLSVFRECVPVYREFEGFEIPENAKEYSDLPKPARDYIEYFEKELGVPVKLIGTGPGRDQIIVR